MKGIYSLAAAVAIASAMHAAELRPMRDDVGFCWNSAAMQRLVDYLKHGEKEKKPSRGLVAAVSPHDDYLYAGRVYYPLFRNLRTREAVIFGVTHGSVRKEINDPHGVLILDDFRFWTAPRKPVPVSELREYLKRGLAPSDFITSNRAHELEHSIEALVPFLQHFNPDVHITPVMVAPMPLARMEELSARLAGVIADYMKEKELTAGRDIFFLISSDGNHYGKDFDNSPFGEGGQAREEALRLDRRLIGSYLSGVLDSGKIEGLTREIWGRTYLDPGSAYWCGKYSVPFGLLTVEKVIGRTLNRKINGRLLRFSDTYAEGVIPLRGTGMGTTAPFSLRHWVSFFSIGYSAE